MPRPAKATRRQIVNASIEYKKGNRKGAYELWAKAADARKERFEAKRGKKQRAAEAAAAEAAAAEKAAAEKAAAEAAPAEDAEG